MPLRIGGDDRVRGVAPQRKQVRELLSSARLLGGLTCDQHRASDATLAVMQGAQLQVEGAPAAVGRQAEELLVADQLPVCADRRAGHSAGSYGRPSEWKIRKTSLRSCMRNEGGADGSSSARFVRRIRRNDPGRRPHRPCSRGGPQARDCQNRWEALRSRGSRPREARCPGGRGLAVKRCRGRHHGPAGRGLTCVGLDARSTIGGSSAKPSRVPVRLSTTPQHARTSEVLRRLAALPRAAPHA